MNTYPRHFHPLRPGCRASSIAAMTALLLMAAPGHAQDEFTLEESAGQAPDPEQVAELTEIQNTLEIGLGHVSDDSFRFGRYTGLEDQGLFPVLNLDFLRRGPYDGDSAEYFGFSVADAGLESREVAFEYGRQGDFGIHVDYDQIPFFRSDSAATVFSGVGTGMLSLPGGWIPATTTAGMTALASNLSPVSLQQERQRWEIGYDKHLAKRWKFSTSFSHEDRDGSKSLGAVIGNSGGNPRAVLLPEPIDYQTQTFGAVASYADSRKQLQFRYHLSVFENDIDALIWQNPYSTIGGWDASAGYPTGFGQISLPPDNRFHQIAVSGGLDVSVNTRLSADLALGRMTQDDSFLPYTINPVLAASITQPLPRDSLDGRIDTTVFNLRLDSAAGERFHWGASFRYDERDNRTPRDQYVYIGGDSQIQDTSVASSRRRYNEPYSFEEHRLRLNAGYRIGSGGRLSASVERKDTERTYSEREEATEDTFSLGWNQEFSDWFGAALRLERAQRDGSTYHGDEPFLSGYDPGYTSTVAGGWENPPDLRKFHLADRERDQLTLMATLTPSESWSIGLEADWANDDYTRSALGLTGTDIGAWTVDFSYAPSENWSAYAFYSKEDFDFDQNGHSITGGNRVADAANPARAWSAFHRDRVDTAGAGLTFPLIGERLEAGIELLHAESRSDIDVSTGAALTSAPLPRLKTRLESLSLRGGYRLNKDLMLNLRYWYERYRSSDWALDGVGPSQLANVILLGEKSANYSVHVVTLSTTFRF
ncbi:MAG: MtrB/PioB family decaheme-associated outer membrane protein [Steroidobacteraceae bacterium]